jgi:hypothetical protein
MDHDARYQVLVRVAGELAPAWAPVFAGVEVTLDDGTTRLAGSLPDVAAVHGLLDAVRDLGLPLVAIEVLVEPRSAHSPGDTR